MMKLVLPVDDNGYFVFPQKFRLFTSALKNLALVVILFVKSKRVQQKNARQYFNMQMNV